MQRATLIAGNWKMNGAKVSVDVLLQGLMQGVAKQPLSKPDCGVEMLVCPPFAYLDLVASALQAQGSGIEVGAQDVSAHEAGAYTGEVSASMIADLGGRYSIVGHSERRTEWAESSKLVSMKFSAAQKANLVPILCVGETREERESGVTLEVISEQLQAVLDYVGISAFQRSVIAYEPVWAIGTGLQATPSQAQEVHSFIRSMLDKENVEIAQEVKVLYGGSVKADNAYELFSQPDIDGALVGGASLQAESFVEIALAAFRSRQVK